MCFLKVAQAFENEAFELHNANSTLQIDLKTSNLNRALSQERGIQIFKAI